MSPPAAENHPDKSLIRFASTMRQIPRTSVRCEVYGTVRAVVDERHVRNIFRKVAPAASQDAIYTALAILSDRLDEACS